MAEKMKYEKEQACCQIPGYTYKYAPLPNLILPKEWTRAEIE